MATSSNSKYPFPHISMSAQKVEKPHDSPSDVLASLREHMGNPEKMRLITQLAESSVPELRFANTVLNSTRATSSARVEASQLTRNGLQDLAQTVTPDTRMAA